MAFFSLCPHIAKGARKISGVSLFFLTKNFYVSKNEEKCQKVHMITYWFMQCLKCFLYFLNFYFSCFTVVPIIALLLSSTQPTPHFHSQSPPHCPCPWVLPVCSLTNSGVSSIRTLIPFIRAPTSWPHHLSKASPPNIITWGIRI